MKFIFTGQETDIFVKGKKRSDKPLELKKHDDKRYKIKK